VLAGLALMLSAVGLSDVIACAVARQTREIGIRIALGAGGVRVVRGFLARGLIMSGLGVAIGFPGRGGIHSAPQGVALRRGRAESR
jgi:ABC-type antimicrobial peptide transport system permease subunit